MPLLAVLLLGLSVSMDALFAGVAYGLKGIRVPGRSLLIIGVVTGLSVTGAMGGGRVFDRAGMTQVAVGVGACLLIGLGLLSILHTYLTDTPQQPPTADPVPPRQLTLSLGRLVITIRVKPEHADRDQSQTIEPGEAILLGVALGLDNMVAVFAVSLMERLPASTPLVMGLLQMVLIAAGIQAAARLQSERLKTCCAYVAGALLLLLGVIRLV